MQEFQAMHNETNTHLLNLPGAWQPVKPTQQHTEGGKDGGSQEVTKVQNTLLALSKPLHCM